MLSNNTTQLAFVGAIAVLGLVALAMYTGAGSLRSNIHACETIQHETEQIDCWHQVIRDTFDEGGTQKAFDVFEYIYEQYDVFASTGCHRHAHRVGDMAYYFDYLTHRDLGEMVFPRNANVCGYGFYHGFFEHLVQDNPDVEFVTDVCTYAQERLGEYAPAIEQTCYHGAGHGFLLAGVDTLTRPEQWSPNAFIDTPLAQCEALPKATSYQRDECRQGVYNVLVDWMADEEFGLSYDYERPFAFCDGEPWERQEDCYYEMAQKLDGASGHDPQNAKRIAQNAKREEFRWRIMSTALAGMVQHDPKGSQETLLGSCLLIEDTVLREACVSGIVGGLVEHDTTSDNYQGAIAFCGNSTLVDKSRNACLDALDFSIRRFKSESDIKTLCAHGVYPEYFCRYTLAS